MSRTIVIALAAAFVVALFAGSTLFTVTQTEQALVVQLGQPVRVISTPGLHAKLPFIQTVILFDRRLLDYEVPPEEVILGGQRRLIVDGLPGFASSIPCGIIRPSVRARRGYGRGSTRWCRHRCAACSATSNC